MGGSKIPAKGNGNMTSSSIKGGSEEFTGNSHGHADGFSDGEIWRGRVVTILSPHLRDVTHNYAQFLVEEFVILKQTVGWM